VGWEYGYRMNLTGASTSNIVIANNSIGPVGTAAIKFSQQTDGLYIQGVVIANNTLSNGSLGIGIDAGASTYWFRNSSIIGNTGYLSGEDVIGINCSGGEAVYIGGNRFTGPGTGNGITIGSQSQRVTLGKNQLYNFASEYSISSTSILNDWYQNSAGGNTPYPDLKIETGLTKHTFANESEKSVVVTFPVAFATLLTVVATQSSGNLTQMVTFTGSPSVTGVTVYLKTRDGSNVTGDEYANWVAFGF